MKPATDFTFPDTTEASLRLEGIPNWVSRYFKYAFLAFLVIVPLFVSLGTMPIRLWDEGRVSVNAFEMYKTGNLLVPTYKYSPDMWNSKPPLLIWLQVGLMKVIGVNEWAVRLPSAMAGLLTCALLLYVSLRYIKSFWFGFIAILVLITAEGYVTEHGTRTGDYDTLLTFFTTLSALAFFAYCETKRTKFLYWFFAATALAVLTKSIAGLLFLPALGLYALLRGQVVPLLKNRHFYLGLAGCVLVIAGYYLLRESANPGFLRVIWYNEMGGRFLRVNEDHPGSFWYYYNNFMYLKFTVWYLWLPCGLAVGLLVKDQRMNRLALFCGLMATFFFLVISLSKTKIHHYDIPLYPFFALLAAMAVYYIFEGLRQFTWINQIMRFNVWPFGFLFLLTFTPYQATLYRTFTPIEHPDTKNFYDLGYILQDAVKGNHDLNGYSLLYEGFNYHNQFYVHVLKEKGIAFDFKNWENLKSGDLVIVPQENVKQCVLELYDHEIVEEIGTITKYRIHGKKQ